MANVVATRAFDMNDPIIFAVEPGSSSVSLDLAYLIGPGIGWYMEGISLSPQAAPFAGYFDGGLIERIVCDDLNGEAWQIGALFHPATRFWQHFSAGDDQGLLAFLLRDDDFFFGSSGADVGKGYAGDDELEGKARSDVLDGGGGDDRLVGGAGADTLIGGGGVDRFVFDQAPTGVADRIVDFTIGKDRILLESAQFDVPEGVLANRYFHSGTQAHDNTDRFIYNPENGRLYYDEDGQGGVARVLIATLSGSPDGVTAADFRVI